MATFAELLVRIGGDATGFTTAMGTVSAQLDKTFTDAQKKIAGFDKLGASLSSIGTHVTAGLTLPIAAVGIASTKMAADFELGMRKVTSLLGGATQQEFKALSDQTLELSRRLGVDAVNAADGLYMAISSGVPKENALSFLEIASKAAIAGMTDTRVAVDGITTVLQSFDLKASETQKVADAMFQAVNIGKMEFPELAAAIGTAAGQAKVLGISYNELLAAGATLTNTTGKKIPEAMTMLAAAIKAVVDPTKEMEALIGKTGASSGVMLLKTKGLEGGLQALSVAAAGNVEVMQKAFGRQEGYLGALGLTGANAARAAKELDILNHSTGAATKAFEEIDKSTARQFTRLTTELKGVSIELGTALLPAVNSLLSGAKPLIGIIADAVRLFTELPQPIQQTAVGLVALAAALGPAIYLTGNLVTGFGALSKAAMIVGPELVLFGNSLKTVSAYASGDLVTALTKGESALLSFLKIARLAAVPIVVGTVVYLALDKLNEYGTKLDSTTEKIKELNKRQNESGALAAQLTHGTVAQAEGVTKVGAAYDSLMGYMKNLNASTDKAKTKTAELTDEQKKHRVEIEKAYEAYGLTDKALEQMERQLGLLWEEYKRGKITIEQYADAGQKLYDETEKKRQTAIDAEKKYWAAIADGWMDFARSTSQVILTFEKHWEDFQTAARQQVKLTVDTFQLIPKEMQTAMLGAIDWARQGSKGINQALASIGTDVLNAADNMAKGTAGIKELGKAFPKELQVAKEAANDYAREVNKAFDHMSRGMAQNIVEWKGFGETLKSVAKDFAEGMIEILIQKLFSPFKKLLADLVGNITDSLAGALKIPTSIWTGGGSAASGVAPSVAGGGGAGAGMAGAAGSSAAAWVGVAATAIGTAITALGQAKMEGTLNAIEKEARYAQIHLYYLLERANLYWPYLQDIHWYLWNRQDKWFESLDGYALRIDAYMDRVARNLDERIAPAVEEARSLLQEIFYTLRDGFGALPAAMVSAVSPIVQAVAGEPSGAATEPAERVATQVPGSVPTTRRGDEPTRRGVAIPLPAAAQYGSADWLTGLLARQEATLANVMKGFDPNNPLGKEDWAAAYAANTGPAYREWMAGIIAGGRDLVAQWATYAKAMAEAARAVTVGAGRAITVNLEGGSARDQEFADMVITRYTRQLKAGGLL